MQKGQQFFLFHALRRFMFFFVNATKGKRRGVIELLKFMKHGISNRTRKKCRRQRLFFPLGGGEKYRKEDDGKLANFVQFWRICLHCLPFHSGLLHMFVSNHVETIEFPSFFVCSLLQLRSIASHGDNDVCFKLKPFKGEFCWLFLEKCF